MGDDFQKFFDRATRIVERALHEEINVFVDYTGGYEDGEGLEGQYRIRKMLTYNNGFVVKENIEDVPFADLTQLCPQEETLDRVDKSLSVFSTHLVKVSVCRC